MSNLGNVVIVPDSFKGTISSSNICKIMSQEIYKFYPDCNIKSIPVADGGEGTVDCFLAVNGGEKVLAKVNGPYFETVEAYYAIIDDGRTAIIEMCSCAGLPYVESIGKKNPAETTTYGVGELILSALNKGCKKIVLGLGGSCTNDAGCGALAALGIEFFDENGDNFIPVGRTLNKIAKVNTSKADIRIKKCDIEIMCDINNPLYGKNGAAYIFSPQKGADKEMVEMLDNNLIYFSNFTQKNIGVDISSISGGGAAGGMGAGMYAYIGGKLSSGIDTILNIVHFDNMLKKCDLVLTGEGRLDSQSLSGKVVIGVARKAKKYNVPVIAVVGDIGDNIDTVYNEGVSAVISTNRVALPFERAKLRSENDMKLTIRELIRILKLKG